MRDYQKELETLREKIVWQRENQRMLKRLQEQEIQYRNRLEDCRKKYCREQKDVERLERLSWSSIWASVKGSKDEDLDRERSEAWTARVRLQEAQRQLEELQLEIADRQARTDHTCEAEYQELLREKEAEYKEKNPAFAARMADIEQRELAAATECRELNEALYAGKRLQTQISTALNSLDSAAGWSTWDMIGGGMMADMMKYSHMDDAQKTMERVQSDLRRYRAELADVAQTVDVDLQTDGFTVAMDIWFDNIFSDWVVRDRIQQAENRLQEVHDRVAALQQQLETRLAAVQQVMEALKQEREETVQKA